MALQFQHVFAGKGVGAGEVQGQAFIQHLLGIGEERPVVGVTWLQLALADRLRQCAGQRTGNTHDANATPALGGGDGGNGFNNGGHALLLNTT